MQLPRLAPWLALALCLTARAALAQSLADGKDVYGPCAACHGADGEGGKGGEYPRVAGQPASFIEASLRQFQQRKRHNMPMVPYTEPRELPERDMKDVAAYLESIKLPSKMPEFKDTDSALERLLAVRQVLIIPAVEGDVEKGKALFRAECASCHGRSARGKASRDAPMLVGQYTNYLTRQYEAFKKGQRAADPNEAMNGMLDDVTPDDFKNILAWLTSIQGQDPEPEPPTKESGRKP